MSETQPIPGVVYFVETGKPGVDDGPVSKHLMYSPWWGRDTEPWRDEDGETYAWQDHWTLLWADFDPHTYQPEWTIGKEKVTDTGIEMSNIRFATRDAAIRTAQESRAIARNGSNKWAAYERKTFTTDWQEIADEH